MNKHEKELITKLFWYLQQNKNEHHIIYNAKEILQSIIRQEYGIAGNLIDAFSQLLVPLPLVTRGTPTIQKLKWVCNRCGWTYRVDYHPSPETLDTMLSEVMPRHNREAPNCSADTGNIICHHVDDSSMPTVTEVKEK